MILITSFKQSSNTSSPQLSMAKCDEGYICSVCGKDVENVLESDLYLRFVIGQVDPELLHTTPEKHIRCNPTLAQFIVHEEFKPVILEDEFAKQHLDSAYVAEQEHLVTRGWRRLHEIKSFEDVSILKFPLPEVIDRLKKRNSD